MQNGFNLGKKRAIEAGRKMQMAVVELANKEGLTPPKYGLRELIGRGSFGLVYKGYENSRSITLQSSPY